MCKIKYSDFTSLSVEENSLKLDAPARCLRGVQGFMNCSCMPSMCLKMYMYVRRRPVQSKCHGKEAYWSK